MVAGRPRTSTPPVEEMIKLGEEMIAWVEENDPLHLSEWWSIEKFIVSKVWDNMIVTKEFSPYYDRALRLIGRKYLDKNSNVREGVSQRWQRVYFKDLRDEENETLANKIREELKAKSEVQQTISDDMLNKFESFFSVIKKAQDARKIDDKSHSDDIKS